LLRDPLKLQLASLGESDGKYSPPNVHFDPIAQPEVALTISGLEIRNDPGRQLSDLKYTLRNESGSKLRSVHIMLTFFNGTDEPTGGERLSVSASLNPGESHALVTSLHHYVDSGDRVAIAITDFETDTQKWHGDHKEIIQAMKRR
jgi:hypothetical protein